MRIVPDTNVLVRAVVRDDERQANLAVEALRQAEGIAVSIVSLCEFVWVLRKAYGFEPSEISGAVEALLRADNVVVNRMAVEAGLAILNAGGDFADGAIAYEGRWLGAETFVSFARKAVSLIAEQGQDARLLS